MFLAERLHQFSFLLRGGHTGGALDPAMATEDRSQTWDMKGVFLWTSSA